PAGDRDHLLPSVRSAGACLYLHRLGLHERSGEFSAKSLGRAAAVRYHFPALGESGRTTSDDPFKIGGICPGRLTCRGGGTLPGQASPGGETSTTEFGCPALRRRAGPRSRFRS